MRQNTEYNKFLISQFVFRCGLTLSIPLFPLYWVRELNAPDSWIGVINTVNSAVLMVAYFLWSKVSERRGNSMVLRVCAFGLVFYFRSLAHAVYAHTLYDLLVYWRM